MRCDPLASQIVVRDELLRKDRVLDRVPHVLGHPGRPAPGEKLRGKKDVNRYHPYQVLDLIIPLANARRR